MLKLLKARAAGNGERKTRLNLLLVPVYLKKKKKNLKPDRSNVPKSLRLQIYQSLGPKAEH